MYPIFRLTLEMFLAGRRPALPSNGTHVSTQRCWPWDLDFLMELNNGRTLTIYDLGRIPLARRVGLVAVLRRRKWGLTVAGSSVRYRKRITVFQKMTIHSRCLGADDRFIYLEQSIWLGGECAGNALYRTAVINRGKMVPPEEVLAEIGGDVPEMVLPEWVTAWIDAEGQRPWPPERTD